MSKKEKGQKQHDPKVTLSFPNFGFIDFEYISIVLIKQDEKNYTPILMFHLKIEDDASTECFHLELDYGGSKQTALDQTIQGVVTLFGTDRLLSLVSVYDTEGDDVEQFDLNSMPEEKRKVSVRHG